MMQTWTLARITYRNAARTPIYYIVIGVFSCLIFVSQYITLFSFDEADELRMIREMGLSSIVVAGLALAIFLSAGVVTEEIEDKTALTLLAKPIGRSQFLLGKFFGIGLALLAMTFFLSLVLVLTLWMDEGLGELDEIFHEGGRPDVLAFALNYFEERIAPLVVGVFLTYVKLLLVTSFSVVVAVNFPLVINATLTMLLFCVGNLSNHLYGVIAESQTFILFRLLGELLYIAIPNLGHFNVTSAVSRGIPIPWQLVVLSTSYGVVVITALLIVGRALMKYKEL